MCKKIGRKLKDGERFVLPVVLPGHKRDGNDLLPFENDEGNLSKKCDQCYEIKLYDEFPDNQNSQAYGLEIWDENGYTGDINRKRDTCNECRKPNGKKDSAEAERVWKKHKIPNPTEKTVCEICGKTYEKNGNKAMFRDHCHDTDTPRGYLCIECNSGLGKFGDTLETINKVKEYLEAVEGNKWKEKFDKQENKLI